MGKVKKKKIVKTKNKPYFSYSVSDVQQALDKIKEGTSIFAASKAFNIPYATLHSRVKGTYPIDAKPGPSSILSKDEEKELVQWIFHLSEYGFPVTKEHLLDNVQNIVKKTNRSTPFTNGRPSRHWYQAFLKRNPEVSDKMSQNLTKSRATVSKSSLQGWFSDVEDHLVSKNLKDVGPERIFNIDESAFLLNPKSGNVLVRKSGKAVHNVHAGDKECCITLIGGNAAGQLLPTMIIYNNDRIPSRVAKHFPDEFILSKSKTGWMTGEMFYSYVVNHFYHWIKKNEIKLPVLLYVDGHSSHLTKALSDFCSEKEIELIALFPNATHIMQPMDVALFHPLKCAYEDAVRTWRIENDGQRLTKEYFATVLQTALSSLDISEILQNGFKQCGLFPFSENSIDYTKLMKSNKSSEICEQENINNRSNDNNSFEINSSEHISYIESNIEPAILEEFKNNDSDEWKGKLEYKELYNFWLNCRRAAIKENKNQIENEFTNNSTI